MFYLLSFCNAKGFLYPFTRNLKNAKYDVNLHAKIKNHSDRSDW